MIPTDRLHQNGSPQIRHANQLTMALPLKIKLLDNSIVFKTGQYLLYILLEIDCNL